MADIFPRERPRGVEDRGAAAVALQQRSERLYPAILKKTGGQPAALDNPISPKMLHMLGGCGQRENPHAVRDHREGTGQSGRIALSGDEVVFHLARSQSEKQDCHGGEKSFSPTDSRRGKEQYKNERYQTAVGIDAGAQARRQGPVEGK